jgi:hypothetical protein
MRHDSRAASCSYSFHLKSTSATIITAGFGETGSAGRQREAALVETIRHAGIR